jgi:hypothetical protein
MFRALRGTFEAIRLAMLWFKFLLGEKMLSNQRIAFGMTISIPSIRFRERGF